MTEINAFKAELVEHFTVFDPYTISEKKLDYLVKAGQKRRETTIQYNVGGKTATIEVADLLPILPDIDDQIIARDLITVEQSEAIVAFYPCLTQPLASSALLDTRVADRGHGPRATASARNRGATSASTTYCTASVGDSPTDARRPKFSERSTHRRQVCLDVAEVFEVFRECAAFAQPLNRSLEIAARFPQHPQPKPTLSQTDLNGRDDLQILCPPLEVAGFRTFFTDRVWTFGDTEQGARIERLAERRLRRYLIWHLRRVRAKTIRTGEDINELFADRVVTELASVEGSLDAREDKIVHSASADCSLAVVVRRQLIRHYASPSFAPTLLEAVRCFEWKSLEAAFEYVVNEEPAQLVPWRS